MVKLLLCAQADVNLKVRDSLHSSLTPLHLAVADFTRREHSSSIVQKLLDARASDNINLRTKVWGTSEVSALDFALGCWFIGIDREKEDDRPRQGRIKRRDR